MRIGVFGATGLIGRALCQDLSGRGETLIRFSRNPRGEGWRSSEGDLDLSGLDAIVNLAGESIGQRWTSSAIERIRESRIGLTKRIVEALAGIAAGERPRVLLNGSAVGIYGDQGESELTEEAAPGTDFLAQLCVDWEAAAREAGDLGLRVVLLRTGIVLGPGADAWERTRFLFRLGIGGKLGSGQQWMPWIHLDDEVGGIRHALGDESVEGPLNLAAPGVVRNSEWTKALAKALHRPAILPVPRFALRIVLGGFAHAVLASARMVPAKLRGSGYAFQFPEVSAAIADLLPENSG